MPEREGAEVLGAFIDAVTLDEAAARIIQWAHARESRTICACNVHSVMTATRSHALRQAINGADLTTPDGLPLAFALRLMGHSHQRRVAGPDLMLECCRRAEHSGLHVMLYGSTEGTLSRLESELRRMFPALTLVESISPPFRGLSDDEDQAVVERINDCAPHLIFVGLGCPKQEIWMHTHHGRVNAPMVGVGAAFDFHAGAVRRAPEWMRHMGLEWLHRLVSEPRRLWRRYLIDSPLFLWRLVVQLVSAGLRHE
jgi:N-acetylglucosaminyldiphosphoundecaprenol N-acetyl-beta-D-mannosaminyltransferase